MTIQTNSPPSIIKIDVPDKLIGIIENLYSYYENKVDLGFYFISVDTKVTLSNILETKKIDREQADELFEVSCMVLGFADALKILFVQKEKSAPEKNLYNYWLIFHFIMKNILLRFMHGISLNQANDH
ncbi:hypothetical protein [Thalassotalea agarivorans]|uniref:Uncharacterized protein n=1 Tax=Thalassotalea agarivorans TaxID=349064 RepID=A0A1I0H4F5_THASX|nr:hypothetical protein [Thalassotalea agarivorans]SET78477.1 hypothetical protein SAMN05660429_02681 [Thalassotalea agarivorans]